MKPYTASVVMYVRVDTDGLLYDDAWHRMPFHFDRQLLAQVAGKRCHARIVLELTPVGGG